MLNLCGSFIFVIVFSASGIPLQDNESYRHASIAATCLIQLFYFAAAAALLFLAVRRSNWDVQPLDGSNSKCFCRTSCKAAAQRCYCSGNATTRSSSAAAGVLRSTTLCSTIIHTIVYARIPRYLPKARPVAGASTWLPLSAVDSAVGDFTRHQISDVESVMCYGFVHFSTHACLFFWIESWYGKEV